MNIQQEQPGNQPLSTAALAHADERTTVENRIQDRPPARGSDPALRESDPAADGGPTLVSQRPRAAAATPEPSHTERGANERLPNRPPASASTTEEEQATPLFSQSESKDFVARWDALQVGFIDEPRRAVEQADNLVASAMKRLAEIFAEERARLEGQWDRGDNVSTEDLRVAMRRYRSFFRRLLAM